MAETPQEKSERERVESEAAAAAIEADQLRQRLKEIRSFDNDLHGQ